MGTKRITWGIFLFAIGVFLLWISFQGEITPTQFLNSFRLPLLPLSIFIAILGFVFFVDGRTIQKQKYVRGGANRALQAEHPKENHDIPTDKIPGMKDLEEPKKKVCPQCKKGIYKDAKVCRFCGHEFPVTYILKVFGPEDKQKFDLLVKRFSERLGKPTEEIEHLLEMGMRFRSSTKAKLEENRIRFEKFGCRVESYKKVSRQ